MNKSDLIEKIMGCQDQLSERDVRLAVESIIEQMSKTLASDDRIEIREFGSFNVHKLAPRQARNPKTGKAVSLDYRHIPHFKPGQQLRQIVNTLYQKELK